MKEYYDYCKDGGHGAQTIEVDQLGENDSGWTITGEIQEDYYKWVNDFEAVHEKFGTVKGNFEDKVFATNKRAYNDFMKNHGYISWDYGDI